MVNVFHMEATMTNEHTSTRTSKTLREWMERMERKRRDWALKKTFKDKRKLEKIQQRNLDESD